MSNKKILGIFLAAFWLVCFAIGYKYSPEINKIIYPSGRVKAESTQVNQASQEAPDSFIEQIDPTKLEALMLETYSEDSGNPLTINSTNQDYAFCDKYEGSDAMTISNPEDYLALVNKKNKLSYDYTPNDLVMLSDYGIPVMGKISARRETAEKLKAMIDDMNKAGFKMLVSSGWRSFAYQQKVLNNWINMVGQKNANNYSAFPGYSEHHLGTTVDILTAENGYTISPNYFNTRTFKWMSENAYKYGFTLSYPQGKQNITGYNPEAWHYRYVGVETATEVHNANTTLMEFLYKKLNICQ